ncbi:MULTISPECIES: WxL domain-containing protein [unclassified Streptomyces]|uniref:WxL domain-containing protein n=1 Tax=unclassified Streptomyces TaxID=2593676 RepID=UPI001BE5C5BE|nr:MULTISPECIES: WxL domain-containing protein [unclassified Streptomyces]MBT2404337.1 beta-xylosidase [Streptomyces sp. ISL-21]MBT2607112.1 beta-xylosidase [Streptomyces sp. ISL-87]
MAVLAAATGGALSAPAAAEGETPPGQVEFPTHCLPPQEAGLPPADGPTTARITVDNPAPRVGDTVTVTYRVARTPAVNPVGAGLPADVLTPTGRILLAGAQSGEVTVVGAERNDPVEVGAALPEVTMTGTFTVTAHGEITLAPGDYTLHTSHLLDLDTACTATGTPVSERLTASPSPSPLPLADLRVVSLGTAYGKPGARVKVSGAGFTPGAAVTVAGRAGAAETGDRVAATADGLGAVLAELAVTDRSTTGVVAFEGAAWSGERGSGPAAYTVIDPAPRPQGTHKTDPAPLPPGTQTVTAVVEPGALAMTQAGEPVVLGAVPYGDGGAARGRIGTVTVKDARGGPAGWSLIGKVTDFGGGNGLRIPGRSLTWTPSCTAAAGSPSTCTPGSAGVVGPEGAVLASTADAPLVGGTFTVDAEVALHVPPYTPPGSYTAVLTLTLS